MQPLDLADAGMIRACYETHVAAMAADDPFEPPVSLAIFTVRLRAGSFEPPREAWYVPSEADGVVAAWYQAEFPDPENRDRVWLTLTVHPARRRAGLGTALLRHAAERAAAAGRAIID
ncbi:MAG: GNAT family N-acetyltransferase, partial [Trebonia sp.]